jgi:hypothetical protein
MFDSLKILRQSKRVVRHPGAFLLLLFSVLFCTNTHAKVYHVSVSGSDSSPGTNGADFSVISMKN